MAGSGKRLVAYCDGGLGNRLNALIGAIYFARRLQLPLSVSWPINRWCGAPLEDLFDSPYPIDRRSMPEIDAQAAGHVLLAHERQAFTQPVLLDPRVVRPGPLVQALRDSLDRADGIVYFNSQVPAYISRHEAAALARTLHIRPEYRQRADAFLAAAGLLGRRYWGLHLRGTDAGFPRRYYAFWFGVSRLLPGRIVLCTDDREVEARFMRNPAVLRHVPGSLPRKAAEGAGWNSVQEDEYGRAFAYNILRDGDAVRESMVDFEILARSSVIPTSRSTFLENALRFGGPVSAMVRLQDARIWLGYMYGTLRSR